MTWILGISAYYHDSAACLVCDGEIVAAAQEERFSRIKHDASFPVHAVENCLETAGISAEHLDYAVFYDKPFLKFERILETFMAYAPAGITAFLPAMQTWLRKKLWIKNLIRKQLGDKPEILFSNHHEAHQASAFYPSPFREAAILTMDGVGEWTTSSYGIGKDSRIDFLGELRYPHSAGMLYSAFTYYLGFRVNSGEYKVMGLAPYGKPVFREKILSNLVDLREDGSFSLDMDYFDYCSGLRMTNENFHELFHAPPRNPDEPITQFHRDIAASIQDVLEEIVSRSVRHIHRETGMDNLVMAGGVALNCAANGKLLAEGPFDRVWVQPAAGDAGGALGAALSVWYRYLGNTREPDGSSDFMHASRLGPSFDDEEILQSLERNGLTAEKFAPSELTEAAADAISRGEVIGWFQGRMEFGPRALGGRSILGDPRPVEMRDHINKKVKFREEFRPFAPSVTIEAAPDWFGIDHIPSPYMLFTFPVERNEIAATTHIDGTARVQTVSEDQDPLFHSLLCAIEKRTGCPVVLNTSFNIRGEPIVCTPDDAVQCFLETGIDTLIAGPYIVRKNSVHSSNRDRQHRAAGLPSPEPKVNSTTKNPIASGNRKIVETDYPSPRRFGISIGTILAILGAAAVIRHGPSASPVIITGLILILTALISPAVLKPVRNSWMRLAESFAKISNTIILTIFFYFIITPVAVISRFAGIEYLFLKPSRDGNSHSPSYWQTVKNRDSGGRDLKKQF